MSEINVFPIRSTIQVGYIRLDQTVERTEAEVVWIHPKAWYRELAVQSW